MVRVAITEVFQDRTHAIVTNTTLIAIFAGRWADYPRHVGGNLTVHSGILISNGLDGRGLERNGLKGRKTMFERPALKQQVAIVRCGDRKAGWVCSNDPESCD